MKKIAELLRLRRDNPAEFRRIVRYLAVGAWNTLFGVGLYTLAVKIFGDRHYLWLAAITQILAVTNAFFCYKYLVFKSTGSVWSEYLKCWTVYGFMALLGLAEIYVLVSWFGMAPIPANFLATGVNVAISYLGHKYFSFRNRQE